jgi:hypothetical protein
LEENGEKGGMGMSSHTRGARRLEHEWCNKIYRIKPKAIELEVRGCIKQGIAMKGLEARGGLSNGGVRLQKKLAGRQSRTGRDAKAFVME